MENRGGGFQILLLLPTQVVRGLLRGAAGFAAPLPPSAGAALVSSVSGEEEFCYFQKA